MTDLSTDYEPALPNRFETIAQVALGSVLWVYARGWWRRARVVRVARTRVTVRYAIHAGGVLRESASCLGQLRRHTADSRHIQTTAAPELGR